jgi:hypothetical protein
MQLSIIYGDVSQNIAADLLIRDSERRCAAVLLRLGGRRLAGPGDKEQVEVPVTQSDLAGAANLSRNSAGTMLQRLAACGLIEQGYRSVAVRAPRALRAFVDEPAIACLDRILEREASEDVLRIPTHRDRPLRDEIRKNCTGRRGLLGHVCPANRSLSSDSRSNASRSDGPIGRGKGAVIFAGLRPAPQGP